MDDYKKLTRVMRYLQAHLDLKLTLSADGSGVVQWWVDAVYVVHYNMKSHTGGTLSMGKCSVYSFLVLKSWFREALQKLRQLVLMIYCRK